MKHAWTIAWLVALSCVVVRFMLLVAYPADITAFGLDFSSDRYPPAKQYAAGGDGWLREQYADLAAALRQPRGSAARAAWMVGMDRASTDVGEFLATATVPSDGYAIRADIVAALDAWRPVRRDAAYALKYCVIRGHIEPGFGPREKFEFFFDAFYCTKASGFIKQRLTAALAHVDAYLSTLRKLSKDSGLDVSHGPDASWDLANCRSFWIYGRPRQTIEYAGTYI